MSLKGNPLIIQKDTDMLSFFYQAILISTLAKSWIVYLKKIVFLGKNRFFLEVEVPGEILG
jgi:hypothetical protein